MIIAFFLFNWIVEGFQNRPPLPSDNNDQSIPKEKFSPEVKAVFEKLKILFENEKVQTDLLPEPYRSKVLAGDACDAIVGAVGKFGKDVRNPIPVNGPLGVLIYLSNLRVKDVGTEIMFHRLGSINEVDVFELVSFSGVTWDFLFFDLYHPRKSRRSPEGYYIAKGAERTDIISGTDEFASNFPDHLMDAISRTNERLVGIRMRPREVREAIERGKLIRPDAHRAEYEALTVLLEGRSGH